MEEEKSEPTRSVHLPSRKPAGRARDGKEWGRWQITDLDKEGTRRRERGLQESPARAPSRGITAAPGRGRASPRARW